MGDYLFIDIRKSDEVYSHRFDKSYNYDVYYIPMYMIRFNVDMIKKHINYKKEIYIVCNSASRSQFIKNKYFSNDSNIIVSNSLQFNNLSHGANNVILNNNTINSPCISKLPRVAFSRSLSIASAIALSRRCCRNEHAFHTVSSSPAVSALQRGTPGAPSPSPPPGTWICTGQCMYCTTSG